MNFLGKRFIFSLKYLTSPFEYRIFTSIILNQTNCYYGNKKRISCHDL